MKAGVVAVRASKIVMVGALALWAIIVAEAAIGLAYLVASWRMARAINRSDNAFHEARALTALGLSVAFGLWFVGFMVIAGEWFVMWQSPDWNAQESTFRFYLTNLAVGICVFIDNDRNDRPSSA
ncbi:MAG: DUF2165 domain-containing protein [Rhodospirillales bacterium]|nr:DUF2165 domain-containing protein [Rhodospirillales bacterium]